MSRECEAVRSGFKQCLADSAQKTCDESDSRRADYQGTQAGFGQLLGNLAPALDLLQPRFAPGARNSSAAALPDLGCAEAALQAVHTSCSMKFELG